MKRMTAYVDAKILNMHDPGLPRRAFVGYYARGGMKRVKEVEANESDDAEVLAVLFAIEELGHRGRMLTVICDHESVVSEANRDEVRHPSELMARLRRELRKRPGVRLKGLKTNPAHGVVTEYVNSLE